MKYLLAISDSTIFFSVNLNIVLRYCYAKLNLMKMKQDCEDRLLMEFVVLQVSLSFLPLGKMDSFYFILIYLFFSKLLLKH